MDVDPAPGTRFSTELVHTKLHPPALAVDLLPRPQLARAISMALSTHRVTLASAPAGYGKTTLLASRSPRSPAPRPNCGWPGSRWTRRTTTRFNS
jgi:ATP/maltotriose-dependent transcriptional regulator MalT